MSSTSRPTFNVNAFDPTKLDDLSDAEFKALVDADLRRKAPKTDVVLRQPLIDALRAPENVERWYQTLVRMSKSVDLQLAARAQDFKAKRAELVAEVIRLDAKLEAGEPINDPDTHRPLPRERALAFVAARKMRIQNLAAEHARSRAATLRFKTGLEDALLEARFRRGGVQQAEAARASALEAAIRAHREFVQNTSLDDGAVDDADERLWATVKDDSMIEV